MKLWIIGFINHFNLLSMLQLIIALKIQFFLKLMFTFFFVLLIIYAMKCLPVHAQIPWKSTVNNSVTKVIISWFYSTVILTHTDWWILTLNSNINCVLCGNLHHIVVHFIFVDFFLSLLFENNPYLFLSVRERKNI